MHTHVNYILCINIIYMPTDFVLDGMDVESLLQIAPTISTGAVNYQITAEGKSYIRMPASSFDHIFYFFSGTGDGLIGDTPPTSMQDLDNAEHDIYTAVDPSNFPDVSWSNAQVSMVGTDVSYAPGSVISTDYHFKANKEGRNEIAVDLMQWWSYDIFGTGRGVDIFTNETAMKNNVSEIDASINISVKTEQITVAESENALNVGDVNTQQEDHITVTITTMLHG